ncbi:MAG: fluoride efflux transporter CrcB [Geminicoccaceae bacterium]|nr:fluoride efflux transporter CrcB [Geminicoccaceae bacterium]
MPLSIFTLLSVAVGGAIGAVSRYLVYVTVARTIGTGFPLATLVVNIAGSFVMGAFVELSATRLQVTPEVRSLIAVGLLGAFTTFSTFSLDVVVLYERGRHLSAAAYVLMSVVFCIAALGLGMAAFRRL